MTDRAKSQARTLHQEASLEITADDHRPWAREEDEGPGSERFYWYIERCPLGGCSQKSWPWKWGCWSYNGPDSCRARLAQHLMGHPAHNLESNRAVAFVNGMKDDNIVMKSQCFKEREKERRETALWIPQRAEAQQQEDEAAQREQRPPTKNPLAAGLVKVRKRIQNKAISRTAAPASQLFESTSCASRSVDPWCFSAWGMSGAFELIEETGDMSRQDHCVWVPSDRIPTL